MCVFYLSPSCALFSMLPVSLDCQYVIVTSVFSNVLHCTWKSFSLITNIKTTIILWHKWLDETLKQPIHITEFKCDLNCKLTLKLVFVLILEFCELNSNKFYLHTDGMYINGLYNFKPVAAVLICGRSVVRAHIGSKKIIKLVFVTSLQSTRN